MILAASTRRYRTDLQLGSDCVPPAASLVTFVPRRSGPGGTRTGARGSGRAAALRLAVPGCHWQGSSPPGRFARHLRSSQKRAGGTRTTPRHSGSLTPFGSRAVTRLLQVLPGRFTHRLVVTRRFVPRAGRDSNPRPSGLFHRRASRTRDRVKSQTLCRTELPALTTATDRYGLRAYDHRVTRTGVRARRRRRRPGPRLRVPPAGATPGRHQAAVRVRSSRA